MKKPARTGRLRFRLTVTGVQRVQNNIIRCDNFIFVKAARITAVSMAAPSNKNEGWPAINQ